MFPSTIMGTHTATFLVCATRVTSPPKVTSSPPATWRVVCGCCFYEGLGHWLEVGGSFRSTLGSLRPLSSLCSLGKYQNFFSFFFTWTTCKIFCEYFFNLFLTFSKTFFQSYSYMYIHVFPSFTWPPRAQPKGGGHCHSWQRAVSHVTPVTVVGRILDPYWVTPWKLRMGLPRGMYIFSHTKDTYVA